MCPTEFTCSVFADGELPESEARGVALHLEICPSCRAVVDGLQAENRLLVQCLQDVDFDLERVPELEAAARPIGIGRFAVGIISVAAAFRICSGILFGFELPAGLEWLDPRAWIVSFGTGVNATFYAIQNGDLLVNAMLTVPFIALATLVFMGMGHLLKRSAAIGTVFGGVLAITFFSSPSYAIDVRQGSAASLPAGEVVDDTLVVSPDHGKGMSSSITVAGTVKGDLIAVGDTVTVSGIVEGDVIAAGRRVEITGTVGGNVIGAAQALVISGEVKRNVAGFAGNIYINKGARIGGNVGAFGGESIVEGSIQRDLFTFGGLLDFRGGVGRNLAFRGGQLSLAPPSQVGGNLTAYVQEEENVRIAQGATVAGTKSIKVQPESPSQYTRPNYYFWQVVRLIAAFVTGLIVFWLAPWLAPTRIVSGMDWLKAGGVGFVALVATPIAVVITAITVIGLPIALSSLVLWLAALYLGKIVLAEFIGRSLFKNNGAAPLFGGLVVVIVAVNIPFLGGLINFLLLLLGMGALAVTLYKRPWRNPGLVMA